MGKNDPRVDAYIEKSADFAKPILKHLRALVHTECPDVIETIKWSFPNFEYKGILCGMASFKEHCAFGFWKSSLVDSRSDKAMGQFGRITSVSDLPKDSVILGYIKKAMEVNESGVKVHPRPRKTKPPFKVPADLSAALKKSAAAQKVFDGFSPGKQRDYVEWITEAKTKETREKRLAIAIAQIKEGKPRHWKYMKA